MISLLTDLNKDMFAPSNNFIRQDSVNIKDLIGDITDIDDDESNLNDFGKKIKANLENTKGFSLGLSSNNGNSNNEWSKKKIPDEEVLRIDPFSGLRILRPLVSTEDMRDKMKGRKMVKLSHIGHNIKNGSSDIESDWVTISVIVEKLPPKIAKNGKQFSIWKLSDLINTHFLVTLFLFGDSHNQHWKIPEGSVIGLLNSKILPSKEKKKSHVTLSIDNPGKLLVLGISKDFGHCKAIKPNGEVCNSIINTSDGILCLYHIAQDYKKLSSMRHEIQTNFNGFEPKNTLLNKISEKKISKKSIGSKISEEERVRKLKILEEFNARKEAENKNLKNYLTSQVSLAAKNVALANEKKKSEIVNKSLESRSVSNVFRKFEELENLSKSPSLARGFSSGDTIIFPADRAKAKAIQLLKLNPIVKKDSNYPKKKPCLENILRKVDENLKHQTESIDFVEKRKRAAEQEREAKKRKLEAIEEILNRKSNHEYEGIVAQCDATEKYFNILEKKEKLEKKMAEITEIDCNVVFCKKCNYTAQSASQLCLDGRHTLTYRKAKKRFFCCKNCKRRTFIYDSVIPDKACIKCGEANWEKTSMHYIKEVKPEEKLLIRGEEYGKFLNSLK